MATAKSCRERSLRSAIVPAASPRRSEGSIRAAKTKPTPDAPPPASSVSQAVAVRSIPCAPDEERVESHKRRKVAELNGVIVRT